MRHCLAAPRTNANNRRRGAWSRSPLRRPVRRFPPDVGVSGGREVTKSRLMLGSALALAGLASGWAAGSAFAGVANWAAALGRPTEAGLYLVIGFLAYRLFRMLWPGSK